MNFQFQVNHVKRLADLLTPVSVYLRLRDQFPKSILLESSDYHSKEESFSYICCEPLANVVVENKAFNSHFPDGTKDVRTLHDPIDFSTSMVDFQAAFSFESADLPFQPSALFGYTAFSAVQHFDTLQFNSEYKAGTVIPDCIYSFFRYVIVFDHFKSELHLFEHIQSHETSQLHQLQSRISRNDQAVYDFQLEGEELSSHTDSDFKASVTQGKAHCQQGDVFQVVLSRSFEQAFKGDDFNVYRALRSINPSPYLFYFDFGDFKLMGSSPEAQLTVRNEEAKIYPIAGTYKRTGDDLKDQEAAQLLSQDPKERAEHVMLVDLARNDLSRHGSNVQVSKYSEIQFFSHVIHLVSEVTASVSDTPAIQIASDTFPAGTLSGAPKYKALELIDCIEPFKRNFYGGAIGMLGFDNTYNHAILIRSFLSKNNVLHFQAGAGVVSKSSEENELQEVTNKVAALRKALKLAQNL